MTDAPPPTLVRHALGEYPVYVEPGVLARLGPLAARHLPARRLALVADTSTAPLFEAFRRAAASPWRAAAAGPAAAPAFDAELTVPAGEASKSRAQWAALSDQLLDRGFGRDSGIVALGGGVVGDLAGFVAATYLRGIPHIQVPTTVVAMLDASVGGKTGVDTAHGKNLIGAFHAPAAVLADPLVLRTLPEREYRAGLAEAVKHGLIADAAYFAWLGASAEALGRRDEAALTTLILGSIAIKAGVVGRDERETGRRAILNAGHTVAHAIEQASGYTVAHGEAVALGLVAECALAEGLGIGRPGLRTEVTGLLARLGLPVTLDAAVARDPVLAAMRTDKKNRAGAVRFALPRDLGVMYGDTGWTVPAPAEAVRKALETL